MPVVMQCHILISVIIFVAYELNLPLNMEKPHYRLQRDGEWILILAHVSRLIYRALTYIAVPLLGPHQPQYIESTLYCRSSGVFQNSYLHDLASIADGMSTLGPVVVAQQVVDPGHLSLQNKCRSADPDRQNLGRSGKISFFIIYKLWQKRASVRQVSDLILKTDIFSHLHGLHDLYAVTATMCLMKITWLIAGIFM